MGWQFWTDDPSPAPREVGLTARARRIGWRTWTAAGLVGFFALFGLLAGAPGALVFGGLAAVLVGVVALIRPSWMGAGTRKMPGLIAAAGLAGLIAGAAIAPPAPVALPAPAATSTASPTETATSPNPTPTASQPTATQPTATPIPRASTTAKPQPKPTTTPGAGTALALLAGLDVKGRAPKTGYGRGQFGSGWATRPDGCTTRETALRRDLADVKLLAADRCIVLGGKLNDPYTGAAFTAKTTSLDELDIDHVVPLSDAWQKGSQKWSSTRRAAFANDLLNLQTTQGGVNSSKGDGDAATWLPPNTSYRCSYVARQIAVKHAYDLSVTKAEKSAMQRVLATCPTQKLPTRASAQKVVDKKPTIVKPKPKSKSKGPTTDPRFPTCKAANAAGYGPYYRGKDTEYGWYRDNDHDGTVCER